MFTGRMFGLAAGVAGMLAGAAHAQVGVLRPLALPEGSTGLSGVRLSMDQSSVMVGGTSQVGGTGPYSGQAVIHRIDTGESIQIPVLGPASYYPPSPVGISTDGSAMLGQRLPNSQSVYEAFAWREGGTVQTLPAFTVGAETFPSNFSPDGSIIAGTTYPPGGQASRAGVWTQDAGNFLLAMEANMTTSSAAFFTPDQRLWGMAFEGEEGWLVRWTIGDGGTSTVERVARTGTGITALQIGFGSSNGRVFFGGRYTSVEQPRQNRPVRLVLGREAESLPFPEDFAFVYIEGCSPDGSEVSIRGFGGPVPATTDRYVWSRRHGLETSAAYLTRRGADLSGWTDLEAWSGTTLGTRVAGWGIFNGTQTPFVVDLLPQCHADLAGAEGGTPDGGVGIDDLLYFLVAFESGTEDADLDDGSMAGLMDGGVNIDDLLFFLTRFEAGC